MEKLNARTKTNNTIVLTEDDFKNQGFETIQSKIFENSKDCNTVIVDLRNIDKVDSVRMSFLVKLHLFLRKEKKNLFLKNVSESVMKVFIETNLDKNFQFELQN